MGKNWKIHESITKESYPVFDPKMLVESSKTYPISINGKVRLKLELSLDLVSDEKIDSTFSDVLIKLFADHDD